MYAVTAYICKTNNANKMKPADIILQQLGGNKFIAMTGSRNFFSKDEGNTLYMELAANIGKVNRLEITLTSMDLYTVKFYKITFSRKNFNCTVSNEKVFENVYEDMLQDLFTSTTGLRTRL